VKGFISYAHDDHVAFRHFRKDIRSTERAYGIKFWADSGINAGSCWRQDIADAIDEASVHLLLCTPAFFDSDYIFGTELPLIDKKCDAGALVIPVILKRCSWSTFVGVLQAVPTAENRRLTPITEWEPSENGFDAARHQIDNAIAGRFQLTPRSPFRWGKR